MPYHSLPQPAPNPPLKIHYTTHGTGSRLLVLIPGLCTPSTMFQPLLNHILRSSPSSAYTILAIDNRGSPPSSTSSAPLLAFSPHTLASDAWSVVDGVVAAAAPHAFRTRVAIVGHSMGGMIAQRMALLRPARVRLAVLMSTHAGGVWNLLPTLPLLRACAWAVAEGLDAAAVARANLSLHFTPRYLEQRIARDPFAERKGRDPRKEKRQNDRVLRRRKEFYFQRYLGGDNGDKCGGEGDVEGASVAQEQPSVLGHIQVVMRHRLRWSELRALSACKRLRVLVISGTDDGVVTPTASRALSRSIGAKAFIELPGSHFVFDEEADHVNDLVTLALNREFAMDWKAEDEMSTGANGAEESEDNFVDGVDPTEHWCECGWCVSPTDEADYASREGEWWWWKHWACFRSMWSPPSDLEKRL